MKKAFLKELAEDIIRKHGDDVSSLTMVLPNRRAGLFFRKYLSESIEKPLWSPEIYSIEDYILKHSNLQIADQITLIFILYQTYKKFSPISEEFERFYYWGDLLLNDYDEIDKYLVDHETLFKELVYQKELESHYDYLLPEQKEAILSFWSSFSFRFSKHQEDFLKTWRVLSTTFVEFKKALLDKGLAYPGMVYRQIAENPLEHSVGQGSGKVVFVGLNALNKAEETIIKHVLSNGKGEIIWDTDKYYMDQHLHEAGVFLRNYRNDKVFSEYFPKELPSNIQSNNERKIKIIGVASEVGQVKRTAELLEELSQNKNWNPQKTAIILPDEKLLFPILNSLPEQLEQLNITMGYPIKGTPIYIFLENLIELHLNSNKQAESFFYKYVLQIVKHAYFLSFNEYQASKIARTIEKTNRISLNSEELSTSENYPNIFTVCPDYQSLLGKLFEVLSYLLLQEISNLEKEFIFQLKSNLTRLKEILAGTEIEISKKTFFKLFKQVMQLVKAPFTGEPLNGLQIMGALESRNLDFENVIILSFNEGAYPRSSKLHSFIPFNLRKGYGLPTFEQQDSIYSYNFFRLLQRSSNVFIFYNASSENGGGEMSRFLYQLLYLSKLKMEHTVVVEDIHVEQPMHIRLPKTTIVKERLNRYLGTSAEKTLTPSAINIYLDCQLKFYFRYVVDLFEPNEVKEEVDPMVFGNLLHRTMESLYQEFMDVKMRKEVKPLDLDILKTKVGKAVEDAFCKEYGGGHNYEITGRNIIIAEIIKKMALRVLDKDRSYAPFNILGLEGGAAGRPFRGFVNIQLEDHSKHKVFLKGIVDRIDKKNDVIRIIDYKTGKDDKKIVDIPSLFDRNHSKRNKAAMQTILYSMIYLQIYGDKDLKITPGIFNIRELFGEGFDHRLEIKTENNYEFINDVRPFLPQFEEHLQLVLEEIFSLDGAFEQTADDKKCKFCAYAGICGK